MGWNLRKRKQFQTKKAEPCNRRVYLSWNRPVSSDYGDFVVEIEWKKKPDFNSKLQLRMVVRYELSNAGKKK
jgi:hypothetical protein